MKQRNYLKKINRLIKQGKFVPGVHEASVMHDDWCPALNGGDTCTCDPEIKIVTLHRRGQDN